MPKFDYKVGQTYRQRDGKTTAIVEIRPNGVAVASNGYNYNLFEREDINSHITGVDPEDEDLMEQLS